MRNISCWFVLFVLSVLSDRVSAQYEDLRCKCTCLSYPKYNLPAQIYTGGVASMYCDCLYVVVPVLNGSIVRKSDLEPYCLRCDCKYEVRSTKTMQVVVCIFIVLIGALVCYMVFMLAADPVMEWIKTGSTHDEARNDLLSRQSSTGVF